MPEAVILSNLNVFGRLVNLHQRIFIGYYLFKISKNKKFRQKIRSQNSPWEKNLGLPFGKMKLPDEGDSLVY